MKHFQLLSMMLGMVVAWCGGQNLRAQGTTVFSYQGHLLVSGSPATSNFDMEFTVFDNSSGGNVISGPLADATIGVTSGLFNVNLDFGSNVFTGNARWLQIGVRPSGSNVVYTTLTPRQPLLPAPYSIFANTSGSLNVTSGGSVTWSNTYAPYGTSVWNVQNGYTAEIFANSSIFIPFLSFVGGSELPALQIFDDPQEGTRGISALNVIATSFGGGTFFGNGSGLTNLYAIPNMQVFTNNGTFVVPTNATRIMVEVWGGGGGGNDAYADIEDNFSYANGGGGGGGYGKGIFCVTNGAIYSVTVGQGGTNSSAGGTSSFGSLICATGVSSDDGYGDGGGGGYSCALINMSGKGGGYGNPPSTMM